MVPDILHYFQLHFTDEEIDFWVFKKARNEIPYGKALLCPQTFWKNQQKVNDGCP